VSFAYDKAELSDEAARDARQERGVSKEVDERPTHDRRPRGFARHERVQPGARRTRANVTRDYLGSLGMNLARVAMVSKGEEQPLCMEKHGSVLLGEPPGHVVITAK